MSFADLVYLPYLAVVVGLFAFVPRAGRPSFLLVASYVFYAYWSVPYAVLLLGITAVDFALGLAIGRTEHARRRRRLVALGVGANVALLVGFKYTGFAFANLNLVLDAWGAGTLSIPDIVLPLGISFYTFQGIGYLLDVHHRQVEPVRDPIELALYIALFPQLVAGPIERAGHLIPQLRRLEPLTVANLSLGARLVLWGLVKKWILADPLRTEVWPAYSDPAAQDSLSLLVAAAALNAVLYLDFSAYTDIARGSARLFGVDLVRNFARPFVARSATEMMQRWHISLATWIRDYLLLPLSPRTPTHASIWRTNLLVLALFGLWHGAAWTFLACGLAVGVLLSIEHSFRLASMRAGRRRRAAALPTGQARSTTWRAGDWARWLAVQLLSSCFFALFFAPDIAFAGRWFARVGAFDLPERGALLGFVAPVLGCLVVALGVHAAADDARLARGWRALGPVGRALWFAGLAAALVFLRVPDAAPFIYFRF